MGQFACGSPFRLPSRMLMPGARRVPGIEFLPAR